MGTESLNFFLNHDKITNISSFCRYIKVSEKGEINEVSFYIFLIFYIIAVLILNSVYGLSDVILTVLYAIFVGALVIHRIVKRNKK